MITTDDLLTLKGKIDKAKTKVSQLEGQKTVLMEQLKTQWGCDTVEQAEKKKAKKEQKKEELQEEKAAKIQELSKKYDFDDI